MATRRTREKFDNRALGNDRHDTDDLDAAKQHPGRRNPLRGERTPRLFWFDPRFLIGVGLVIVSVVGVYAIVYLTDTTVEVYTATTQLSPGDRLVASELTTAHVRLGDVENRYLTPSDVPADGLVVTRQVAIGELIPSAAVGSAAGVRVASVVVTVAGQLSQSIGPGALVDMWSAKAEDRSVFGPPSVLVGGATVVRVVEASGLIAERGQGVEVLVPRERVARVLEALANGDAIALVPASIPVGR